MSNPAVTHEGFMNVSRMILPRVGVGVGVRGGCVVTHAFHLKVDARDAACMGGSAAEFGGGR